MNIINTYHFNVFHASKEGAQDMLAVLTQDSAGLFACYLGAWDAPKPSGGGSNYDEAREKCSSRIAFSGEKQNFTKSQAYFQGITEKQYRA